MQADFTFIDTFENYRKEESGDKSNHVVTLGKLPKKYISLIADMITSKKFGTIKLRMGYTKKYFIRTLTDITIWDGSVIFSW